LPESWPDIIIFSLDIPKESLWEWISNIKSNRKLITELHKISNAIQFLADFWHGAEARFVIVSHDIGTANAMLTQHAPICSMRRQSATNEA
jgi:hypothetical protein